MMKRIARSLLVIAIAITMQVLTALACYLYLAHEYFWGLAVGIPLSFAFSVLISDFLPENL